jgi:hypothetical protein
MDDVTQSALLKIAALLLGGSWVIQISPVNINPWTWIFRSLGRAINAELIEKVDKLGKRIDQMEEHDAEREAKSARIRILRFGDECQQQVLHSQEHFDQIIEDIDQYETYCAEHPTFKNNKAVLTIANIKETYRRRVAANDFLK